MNKGIQLKEAGEKDLIVEISSILCSLLARTGAPILIVRTVQMPKEIA
ncbi:MAG: hypothetical protein QGG84_02525 [Rhodospirillales bacterium]|nr:hypothetical protein [Rhodospirillales bacterium]